MRTYQITMSVHIPHVNSLQSTMSLQVLVNIHFTLLGYASEHICLPHQTCMPHCTSNVVYMWTPQILYVQVKQNNELQLYHTINIYVQATNFPLKCLNYATYSNYFMWRYGQTISLYLPHYELSAMNSVDHDHWHACILYCWQLLQNKCACHIVCVPLYFYCSLHIDPSFLHTSEKNK